MSSTHAPTKDQRAHFDLLHQLGCVVCFVYFKQFRPPDISHLLSGGVRIGHDGTIPECVWHHRGVLPDGYNDTTARKILGPSRAHGAKPYAERFGTDTELREMTGALLSKIKATKRTWSPAPRKDAVAPPIKPGQWTRCGAFYVKTKSMGAAEKVVAESPQGKSGIVGGVEWMLVADFERATQ
jgi:hypothetical protein